MRTSPEKRSPSGSKEHSTATKLGAVGTAIVLSIEALFVGACGAAQGGDKQVTPPSTTATDKAPTAAPIIDETSTQKPTSEATTDAKQDTTENAAPEEYTMPKNAKPAKDMVNGFFANYTIDDISNMRPLGLWLIDSENIIKEAAQLLGAIRVNALETYERATGVGSELAKDNSLLHDIHTMSPEKLARTLDLPLHYAMLDNGGDMVNASSVGASNLDVDRAKKLACLHMCSGSSNQWVRFRDFLDGYSPHKNIKKPATTEYYIDTTEPGQPTAVITESQMVEVGDLGKVELVTIEREGDNLQPKRKWKERWLLVPYSALPELPGINGESSERDPSFNDPVDFNRPRPDGNGGYVTLDGTPAIVPVLLN